MMKKYLIIIISLLCCTSMITAQDITGQWKTIDDATGQERSIVEIYQQGKKYFGKINNLLIKPEHDTCVECKGDKKNKPLLGLEIITNLEKDGEEWNGGHILDPKTGKVYKCYLELEAPDKLKVRGYVGFSLIGRTQYWHRVK